MIRATILHVAGVNCLTKASIDRRCEECILGSLTRAQRTLAKSTDSGFKSPVKKMYSDLFGPMKTTSLGKSICFVSCWMNLADIPWFVLSIKNVRLEKL